MNLGGLGLHNVVREKSRTRLPSPPTACLPFFGCNNVGNHLGVVKISRRWRPRPSRSKIGRHHEYRIKMIGCLTSAKLKIPPPPNAESLRGFCSFRWRLLEVGRDLPSQLMAKTMQMQCMRYYSPDGNCSFTYLCCWLIEPFHTYTCRVPLRGKGGSKAYDANWRTIWP